MMDEAGKRLSGAPAWPSTNPGYTNILSQEVKISTQGPFLDCVYGFETKSQLPP